MIMQQVNDIYQVGEPHVIRKLFIMGGANVISMNSNIKTGNINCCWVSKVVCVREIFIIRCDYKVGHINAS